ncbi:MAG: RNA polymerase factor sigma-54 [Myxococcota bacterium]|nr:RNA polymerase factor sigma-54 [Myxococcota bacterium]
MALQLRLQQKLAQQLVMTPQLQQAIKLLQLSHLEMANAIQHELEENPVLEERGQDSDSREDAPLSTELPREIDRPQLDNDGMMGLNPESPDTGKVREDQEILRDMQSLESAQTESNPEPSAQEVRQDIDWENYADSYSMGLPNGAGAGSLEDAPSLEATVAAPSSLTDHLKAQLQHNRLSEREKQLSYLVIEELTEDGYLPEDIIATLLADLEVHGITRDELELIVAEIQTLDPIGVASYSIRDCLLKQLHQLTKPEPLAIQVVDRFLPELENRQYKKIAKELGCPMSSLGETLEILKQLDPRPGRAFNPRTTQYISPDIYIKKVNGTWVIIPNEEGIPRLRISNYYHETGANLSSDAKSYLQDKVRSASWLLRSIQMRQRTLYKVMESILKFQENFFENGPEHLKPLILKDVADDIEMHESTISRVTSNKYVHTPRGTYELKYFFNSSIQKEGGSSVASESVRNRIKDLVTNENPQKPLSDQAIVKALQEFDLKIARRTVAKYREMLGIAPSSKRKKVF